MRYTVKLHELSSFIHNAWYSPPADMLLPLMVKSLQQSGYFRVIASTSTADATDYRIDTQLIDLKQNFLKYPSQIDFTVKVVLSHVPYSRVIASKIMDYHIICKEKTPFGGVIAANEATKRFTAELTDFIMLHLMNQHGDGR
jgi:cholesterol transport system auxiliary component